jgi:putative transposase
MINAQLLPERQKQTTDNEQTDSVWLSSKQVSDLLKISVREVNRRCKDGRFTTTTTVIANGGLQYRVDLNCLPAAARAKYYSSHIEQFKKPDETSVEAEVYSKSPEWARKQVDKYMMILRGCEGIYGRKELESWVSSWNNLHPELSTSYPSICRARKTIREQGASGLLAQYGNRAGTTSVKDEWYSYFKQAYLKEGAPSAKSCWYYTLGFAKQFYPDVDPATFPSEKAFLRRIDADVPEGSQYYARYGESAWNRKYASYIDRDYSNVRAGQVWVGDAAQIDIAVIFPDGRVGFPWVTAWRDMLTSKWLGWCVHCESPKSDHVFESLHYGVEDWGLCEEVLIDNGKTYRCRDFAGGRKNHKLELDEIKTTSMLGLLGVKPRFALPYGAQSKPIERDFLKTKELLSKHIIGYRGGDVTEKPEKLADEVLAKAVMPFNDFVAAFDDYIINGLNKIQSKGGKNLLGRSPDQAWAQLFTEKREVSPDALSLFCMRTSNVVSIGRNGVHDSALGVTYWGEWMPAAKGQRVYIRRSLRNYATAWVFKADNDECLGRARMNEFSVPALAETEVEKAALQKAMEQRRRDRKITQAYIKHMRGDKVDPMTQLQHLKMGINAVSGETAEASPKVHRIVDTAMDRVIAQEKERETEHQGIREYLPNRPQPQAEEPIYLYDTERKRAESKKVG